MRRRTGLGLILAWAILCAAAAAQPRAEVVGHFDWLAEDADFGGISSLELDRDGLGFFAASDRATVFSGRLERNADGAVTAAAITATAQLAGRDGRPIRGRDSEGLARFPDGRLAVSFEQSHRVTFQPRPGAASVSFPARGLAGLGRNSGLEALAVDSTGTVWALSEGRQGGVHVVLRLAQGNWQRPLALPAQENWRPVGADFGPDGRLYLLERDFWPLLGFLTRIVRLDIGADGPGPREVLFQSRAGAYGNFEGLAVWQDHAGRIRLTLVADDNFLPFHATELLDLRIIE